MSELVEFHRIYKSLPLDDLMEMMSFVFAKANVYLVPIIQDINYQKKERKETSLKQQFLKRCEIIARETPCMNMVENSHRYDVTIIRKD